MRTLTHIRQSSDGRVSVTQQLVCTDGRLGVATGILPMLENHLVDWLYLRGVDTGYALRQRLLNSKQGEVFTVELSY